MHRKNSSPKESEIISFLQKHCKHIGDDAAILPLSKRLNYVISKDLLVEDVHFRLRYYSPEALAHKALHVNLSDMAAMGALPKYVLLGAAIPKNFDSHYIMTFLKKFISSCKAFNVELVGGDTNRSSGKLFISVTIIGEALKQHIKLRSMAKPTDYIFVAGNIGHAHIGLTSLEQNKPGFKAFKTKFLKPTACVSEGIWLGKQRGVTSMMDLSDGLYQDACKLCSASGVGAHIYSPLAFTKDFQKACKALNLNLEEVQLGGGEDYALLFTVKKDSMDKIQKDFLKMFKYPLQFVGTIVRGKRGVLIKKEGGSLSKPKNLPTFSHF